jgi:hypothetical protein
MQNYELREAMVAVSRDEDGHTKIITLPAGAVLTVERITLQSGLVDAQWDDRTVSVFIQDLKTRSGLVQAAGVVLR